MQRSRTRCAGPAAAVSVGQWLIATTRPGTARYDGAAPAVGRLAPAVGRLPPYTRASTTPAVTTVARTASARTTRRAETVVASMMFMAFLLSLGPGGLMTTTLAGIRREYRPPADTTPKSPAGQRLRTHWRDLGRADLHPRQQELVEHREVVGLDDHVDRVLHERAVDAVHGHLAHRGVVELARPAAAVRAVFGCVDLRDVEEHGSGWHRVSRDGTPECRGSLVSG